MPPKKRLLLFANKLGYQTREFNAAAEKLGVEIVFVTDRCQQLKDPWGDSALSAHFESPEAASYSVLHSVRDMEIDGVLAVGDRPTVTAAYVARGLGMHHANHPLAVEACRNKLRMREVFRDAGLPTPAFRMLPFEPMPEPVLLGLNYPLVVKPLSLSASQGVMRVNDRSEFQNGTERLRRLLESAEIRATREPFLDRMLLESYIPGQEVAVEGLLTEGALRILAIFDKPDPLEGPFFEETIYVTPSRLPEADQKAIEKATRDAVQALGLTHGPVHAEFRINAQGIWPVEVAARPIGGLCARSLRFELTPGGEKISLEELLLRHAVGLPGGDAKREEEASGVLMIPVPKSGVFERVEGVEAAKTVPGVTNLKITARKEDYLAAWPEGSSYLGFLFAKGSDSAAVEASIREAHSKLKFTLTDRLPVQHPVTKKLSPGSVAD